MPKITLPPKVKCWRCIDGQITVTVGRILPGPDIPEDMVGKPLYGFEPCDCDDGERYVFDDAEKALLEHDFLYKVFGYPKGCEAYIIPCVAVSDRVEFIRLMACVSAKGRDGTAALVNAIKKWNSQPHHGPTKRDNEVRVNANPRVY